MPKKRPTVKQCIDDLKKLRGLPPYDGADNPCRWDGIFAISLREKSSETVMKKARAKLKGQT